MNTVQSNRWPVTLATGGAGRFDVLTAPDIESSHYLLGIGSSANCQVNLPRRQCFICDAAAAADIITYGDNANLEVADAKDAVFLFWFKIASGQVSIADFISKEDTGDGYTAEIDANGKLKFTIGDGTAVAVTSAIAVNDGLWHHCGIYFQVDAETDGLIMYIDNDKTAKGNTTDDVSGITGAITGGTDDLVIGGGTSATKIVSISQMGLYVATDLSSTYTTIISNHYNERAGQPVGTKFTGSETNLQWATNTDFGSGTTDASVAGSVDGTLAAAAIWSDGDGAPFQDYRNQDSTATPPDETLPLVSVNLLAAGNNFVQFPHPIKVGRNHPLTIIATASATLTFYGYTDSAGK